MKRNQKTTYTHVLIIIVCIMLLVAIGIGSYIIIQSIFKAENSVLEVDNEKQTIAADVTIDFNAINLIYEIDNDKIIQVLLEVLNSETKTINYISMPGNTELKLSSDVEKKLEKFDVEIKEDSIKLSELTKKYGNNAFQFGQLIISDVLEMDISYYTVMTKKTFVKYFVEDNVEFYVENRKYEYDMQVLSDTFKTKLRQFDVQLDQIIKDAYKELVSNLSMENKMKYIEHFQNINVDKIYNWHIIGKEKNNKFVIEEKSTNKIIGFILNNTEEYKYTQEQYNDLMEMNLNQN